MLYTSILKHGLTQEAIELDTQHGSIAAVANNVQGACSWWTFQMGTSPTTWDRVLAGASGVAIGSVSANQQVWFESSNSKLMMRNNANQTCYVTVFKCIPRIDIGTAYDVVGANPSYFKNGFLQTATESGATSAVAYSDWNATPYMSSTWCSMFKIKPVVKKMLEPGENLDVAYRMKKGNLIKKSTYGIANTSSFASNYKHLKKNGAIFLVKVHGGIVHDESKATTPETVASDLGVTTGGYNVDFIFSNKVVYRAPFLTPTRTQGQFNVLPSTITIANEAQFEQAIAAETTMAI